MQSTTNTALRGVARRSPGTDPLQVLLAQRLLPSRFLWRALAGLVLLAGLVVFALFY